MHTRYRYHDGGPPAGLSFLLFLLAVVALCVAAVYLKASTLHEREIKITAYEQTISKWTSFRPTFSRLSVNVTAYLATAPPNTTDPGLDPNPSPPGVTISLLKSEVPDPIHDEEGEAGGLPEYSPLKYELGVLPPSWRTTLHSPPQEEEEGEPDSSETSPEISSDRSSEIPGADGANNVTDATGSAGDDDRTDGADEEPGGKNRRRRMQRSRHGLEDEDRSSSDSWQRDVGPEFTTGELFPAEEFPVPEPALAAEDGILMERESKAEESEASADEGGETEEASLPTGFIPEVDFDDAPSIRFVFSARLDPVSPKSKGSGSANSSSSSSSNSSGGSGGSGGGSAPGGNKGTRSRRNTRQLLDGHEQEAHLPSNHDRLGLGRRELLDVVAAGAADGPTSSLNSGVTKGKKQRNSNGSDEWGPAKRSNPYGGRGSNRRKHIAKGGKRRAHHAHRAPILAELETDWAPLARIRQEHAPMPAPETKCMQIFGGVHNYRTKMCEVYERLSRICVQVYIDEERGEIGFSTTKELGELEEEGDDGTRESAEEDDEEDADMGRYGCDPRTGWSPWGYSVLPVDGRTTMDVIPPESISFVESLITVRSELDPFLLVEAITYEPYGEGGAGGGVRASGGAAGGDLGDVDSTGVAGAGDSGGSGFLTFGLSSQSCAAVGFTFLVAGVLLMVQPMFALRTWWRDADRGGADDRSPGDGRRGGSGGEGSNSGEVASRRALGQWRYNQVGDEWDEDSELDEPGDFDEMHADYDFNGDGRGDEYDWQSDGEWHGDKPRREKPASSQSRGAGGGRLKRGLEASSLRRRATEGSSEGDVLLVQVTPEEHLQDHQRSPVRVTSPRHASAASSPKT